MLNLEGRVNDVFCVFAGNSIVLLRNLFMAGGTLLIEPLDQAELL